MGFGNKINARTRRIQLAARDEAASAFLCCLDHVGDGIGAALRGVQQFVEISSGARHGVLRMNFRLPESY